MTFVLSEEASYGRRPEASTCTHELILPAYSSKEMLRERLVEKLELLAVDGSFGRE